VQCRIPGKHWSSIVRKGYMKDMKLPIDTNVLLDLIIRKRRIAYEKFK
jgi:hypothetical protein